MLAAAPVIRSSAGPRVCVLMPTFNQAAFLARAVGSLLAQTIPEWELVVIDDGCTDDTPAVVKPFLTDARIRCHRLPSNHGLGAALNAGLALSRAPLIAYLPSDDLYDHDHLARLLAVMADPEVVLAWSGVRHHGRAASTSAPPGHDLQLVQVMHRRTNDRWVERDELESNDLERLFWAALRQRGPTRATGCITCEWTDHPGQRHKAIRESFDGGLNVFRHRYGVTRPLRLHSTDSGYTDEIALYQRFRERPASLPRVDGLKILLVGELSFNPERILALEERGHRLYGLWTPDGLGDNTVGPLPFGHVEDLPRHNWQDAIRRLRPDVIYGLLGWRAVPFAHAVLEVDLGVPFVWHFKEAPHHSIRRGEWGQLVDLYTRSAAQVYSSPEERGWFQAALPGRLPEEHTLVLDGDLPKADWFTDQRTQPLSERDGQVHTVVLGRPLGLDASLVRTLTTHSIHIHFHGLVRAPGPKGAWTSWLHQAQQAAPGYVHVHPHVDQRNWVRVLSRYDAGWLHRVHSDNGGDLRRASWDDLNYPARIPPLLAAGVPLLQQHSPGCVVAASRLIAAHGFGVRYTDVEDLCAQLADHAAMQRRQAAAWEQRTLFAFDTHVDRLLALFAAVVGESRIT